MNVTGYIATTLGDQQQEHMLMTIRVLYHGTTPSIASSLLSGHIKNALGGGEFGQGFYMGTSKRLAKRRGYHKTFTTMGTAAAAMAMANNTLAVTLDVPRHKFTYWCRDLDLRQSIGLYGSIRKHGSYKSYQDDHDAIVGLIVGNSRYYSATQYKFQSQRAETCLNVGCPNGSVQRKAIV